MTRCAVIGAGAWGTALADLLARNGHETRIWAYEWDVVESINRSHLNRRFLAGHPLFDTLTAYNGMEQALEDVELVTLAAPSHVLRAIVRSAAPFIRESATIVVASKGIEPDTLALMTDIASEELRGTTVVALSGPSFASEVVAQQPTAVVVASRSEEAALLAQQAFSSKHFRAYTHSDVTGVEIGGSLKNVMAVATGIADGLGLGLGPVNPMNVPVMIVDPPFRIAIVDPTTTGGTTCPSSVRFLSRPSPPEMNIDPTLILSTTTASCVPPARFT